MASSLLTFFWSFLLIQERKDALWEDISSMYNNVSSNYESLARDNYLLAESDLFFLWLLIFVSSHDDWFCFLMSIIYFVPNLWEQYPGAEVLSFVLGVFSLLMIFCVLGLDFGGSVKDIVRAKFAIPCCLHLFYRMTWQSRTDWNLTFSFFHFVEGQ